MVKGLLVINLYLWNNCSSLSLQTAERRVKPGFYGKTYRCHGSCKNIISYQTCFYSRPLNNLRHQVFHHKRKQSVIGHIIEPLFCQQTKCYLVTNQVKNQVWLEIRNQRFSRVNRKSTYNCNCLVVLLSSNDWNCTKIQMLIWRITTSPAPLDEQRVWSTWSWPTCWWSQISTPSTLRWGVTKAFF